MSDSNEYRYPDTDDRIALAAMDSILPSSDWWRYAEERVLKIIFRRYLATGKELIIDLGCGRGRHLEYFSSKAKRVKAFEPDRERFKVAQFAVAEKKLGNVEVFNYNHQFFSNLGLKADLIFCSHVIQHINDASVEELFRASKAALATHGVFIFATCVSTFNREDFTFSSLNGASFVENRGCKSVFEQEIARNTLNILPTRRFSRRKLLELCHSHFSSCESYSYNNHFCKWIPGFRRFREYLCQTGFGKRYLGMDMFFCCTSPKV